MVKQINLDSWQIQHMTDLLKQGSIIVSKTNTPMILYRQTLEDKDGSYEEIICTLTIDYVIEQLVTSGGIFPPSIKEQIVFPIQEYPQKLIRKSRDRFLQIVKVLEEHLE